MLKQWVWRQIKPAIRAWLRDRALVIPAKDRAAIAKRIGIAIVDVEAVNAEIIAYALSEFERFRP